MEENDTEMKSIPILSKTIDPNNKGTLHQFKSANNDSEQNFICEACQTGFSSMDTLDNHLCNFHVVKRRSKCLCGLCKKEFTTLEPLKIHLQRYHTLRKLDSCGQCGAKVPVHCCAPTHSAMKLSCDQCKTKRHNTKNKAAKDLKVKNSKSVPNIEKIEQHTEEYFENINYGELSNCTKNENVNSWGQRADGIKIVSVVGSVQQPRSRSTLGELNNFCNSYFLEGPPVMVLGGNHFGLTFSRQNTTSENNISIASKNMITVEGKEEPVGYKKVLTGLNSFCNGFYQGSSTMTNAASHRRGGVALNLLSTISERDISIPIIRAGSDNLSGNKMVLSVPNSYYNNFLQESITATVASNFLPTVPERNVPNEIIISQKENEGLPASVNTSNAQNIHCNNNFCDKGSTMEVTGSHRLFGLAPNSHNTISYQNVSIATEKLITKEESEKPSANINVPKALNTDCNNNFYEVGSTPVVIGSLHLLELTPSSQNTLSEKKVSIAKEKMITEEESKEPPANNNVPTAQNTCYDFCEEGSTTAVADSHHLLGLANKYKNSVSEKKASIAKEEIITGEESEESSGNKKVLNALNTYCSNDFGEDVSSIAVTGNHHLLGFAPSSQNMISFKKLSIASEEIITRAESKEPPANNNVPYAINNDCNNDFCEEISSTVGHDLLGLALSSQSTVSDKNVSMTLEKIITEESEDPLENKMVLAELNTYSNDFCQEGSKKKSLVPHHSEVAPNSQSIVSKGKDLHPESGHIGGRKDIFFCRICCLDFLSFDFLEDHLCCTHVVENSTKSFFCETCKKGFKKLEILIKHLLLRHTMKKIYSCGKCGMQFPYPHTTTAHPRTKLYCAGRCQKIEHDDKSKKVTVNQKEKVDDSEKASDSKQKLIVEEDTEKVAENGSELGEKKTYSCEFCQEVFASRTEQLRHSRLQHSSKPYSCDLCGKKFTGSGFLKNHYLKNHSQEHSCDVCHGRFSGKRELRAHRRLLHAESEKHTCETCKKECRSKASLYAHSRTHNLNHPCDLCDRKFYSERYLLDHRRQHTGEKPYVCDLCGRKFRLKESLNNHRRSHSSSRETHACDVCLKEFKNKGWLRVHRRTHTGERPYPCHVCDKKFINLSYLKRHLMCHTGEKPHVCEVCGRGFAKREHLKTHVRVHTGEKPYVCDFCGRGFSQKWVMYTHRRIHTGERPFECEVCQRGFIYKSEMKRHQLSHLKNELKN